MKDNTASEAAVLKPTPTKGGIAFRPGDFSTLGEALDYAANSRTGVNFYRANVLEASVTYGELRQRALLVASRMQDQNLPRGSRVALVADTTVDFIVFFFACQYAGLVPTPLPAIVNVSGRQAFVKQIKELIQASEARIAVASNNFVAHLVEACRDVPLTFRGTYQEFMELPVSNTDAPLHPLGPEEVAYIQYTSGSTRSPRGVMVQSKAAMANIVGIVQHGIRVTSDDRCVSWLPFYHDMGLVGSMLTPIATQCSADYMSTREFAVRPRLWLELMSRSKATVSFSPPFGYELCAKRLAKGRADQYDLSNWRVAGVGAEMIRSDVLRQFAKVLKPAKFHPTAFLPCYGMAECSLAISFAKPEEMFSVDEIDKDHCADHSVAISGTGTKSQRTFVSCGYPLPKHEIQIRNDDGQELPERHMGMIFVRGPSVMRGYLNKPELTAEVLSDDCWLNTGDLGYMVDGQLFVTGRHKDLIIINGRNIWPQDLEAIAEDQPGVRSGDVLAFALPSEEVYNREGAVSDVEGSVRSGSERAIIVIQSREKDSAKRAQLISNVARTVQMDFGISCEIQLVPAHTLPRTSSGKLSRSQARRNFIQSSLSTETSTPNEFSA